MTETFTAPMHTKTDFYAGRKPSSGNAFVLFELLVVIAILAILTTVAMFNVTGMMAKSRFNSEVQQFISAVRMAVTSSAESGRKYEIIIDIIEQTYTVREITSPDLTQILDEEIIYENQFSENCIVYYVQFDDLTVADENDEGNIAKFRTGRSGLQYGGKVVFLDGDDNEYTVLINRLNRTVELAKGDLDLLVPVDGAELVF